MLRHKHIYFLAVFSLLAVFFTPVVSHAEAIEIGGS
jgi:hypothetical protein